MSANGLDEPLPPGAAKIHLRAALASGAVSFSGHALGEMRNDGITEDEALAVLRGGVVEPAELERGSWQHRVRAGRVFVVITFRAADRVAVVTAWRSER
jgi:hypothetical protein